MRVAITGAGLIGTHAAAELAARGHEVALYDIAPDGTYVRDVVGELPVAALRLDVTDLDALVAALAERPVDAVVHTVARIGGVAQRQPREAFRVNVGGTVCVAEASRRSGVRRLVYVSSRAVYDPRRVTEAAILESGPTAARSVYAASKLAAEHVLEAYTTVAAFAVTVLRFCNIFGYGHYRGGSGRGRALDTLVRGVLGGEEVPVPPALAGAKEWLYVKDTARAIASSVEREGAEGYEVINVGSGTLHDERDLVTAIRDSLPAAKIAPAARPSEQERAAQPLDIRRARERLGFVQRYELASALADYVVALRAARAAPAT